MNDNFKRFDMKKKPISCKWFLKPVVRLISSTGLSKHKTKIEKIGLEGLEPPYVLLGNHNAFFDMSVSAAVTKPHVANYIVAIDGYIGREWLLRWVGCICKRKFTFDMTMVKHLKTVINNKGILAVYPEARYSLCGTQAPLPESLGKLCKMLNVPVVSVICHGHHINHPFWNTRHERGVKPTEATAKLLISKDEIDTLSAEEINKKITDEFVYDDFAWQREKQIKVDCKDRAVGLEKILYQCPHCKKEFEMVSDGTKIKCKACGKTWTMSEYGELAADEGETEFSHIPDWYEWERENVKKEVAEGTYSSGILPVTVESLPNAKKFVKLGSGTMIHDMNGFKVKITADDGTEYEMTKPVPSLYSCHIEYEYLFKHGDCVDLNTLEDTWYTYPYDKPFSVTKMALATEELYYDYCRKNNMKAKSGTLA